MPNSNFSPKNISVIIVNFRSDQHLEKCIASLYNFEFQKDWEIIVVNNDPETTLEKIKILFPQVKILHNPENIGFGKAVNFGVKEAKGEILFFLNPDSEIMESIFSRVFAKFNEDPSLAVLSPKIVDEKGQEKAWIFGKKINLSQVLKNNLRGWKKENIIKAKEVDWVSGAGMWVRQEDFEKVGGFDENFFLYFEDVDLCRRLRKRGKKIIYFPESEITHLGSGSQMEEKERKKVYYASQDYYFQKHFGKFQANALKIIRKIFI